jgi:hypothetical protein
MFANMPAEDYIKERLDGILMQKLATIMGWRTDDYNGRMAWHSPIVLSDIPENREWIEESLRLNRERSLEPNALMSCNENTRSPQNPSVCGRYKSELTLKQIEKYEKISYSCLQANNHEI